MYKSNEVKISNRWVQQFIFILLTILVFTGTRALAGEYKIYEDRVYNGEFLELGRVEKDGISLEEVLNLTKPNNEHLPIRIMNPISKETAREMVALYRQKYPKDLDRALKSSGNMHNPALVGVQAKFTEIFKATSYYLGLVTTLNKFGYDIDEWIEYEKFEFHSGPQVEEIWLNCKRTVLQK